MIFIKSGETIISGLLRIVLAVLLGMSSICAQLPDSLLNQGVDHFMVNNNFDTLIHYSEQGLELAQKQQDTSAILQAHVQLGFAYYQQNKTESAKDYFKKGLEYAISSGNLEKEARFLSSLGSVAQLEEDYDLAVDYFFRVLSIHRKQSDHHILAYTHLNIAGVFHVANQGEKVLEYLDSAQLYLKSINDPYTKGEALIIAANLYRDYDLHQSEKIAKNVLKMSLKESFPYLESTARVTLASIAASDKRYEQALYYESDIIDSILVPTDKLILYSSLAMSYSHMGDGDKAIDYLRKIEKLQDVVGHEFYESKFIDLSYNVYKAAGDYEKALHYLEKYEVFTDSMTSRKNAEMINDLEKKYKTQQKDAEIANLQKSQEIDRLEIERKNAILIASVLMSVLLVSGMVIFYRKRVAKNKTEAELNRLKLLRSQLNPHFVFNTISAIQSMVIEGKRTGIEISDEISKFSRLIREILNSSDIDYVSIHAEISFLQTYLEVQSLRFDDQFIFNIHIGEQVDDSCKIPVLILQPFVENAIEHGMKNVENGIIDISIQRSQNKLVITISDNGPGLTPNADSSHESKALSIISRRFKILNQTKKGHRYSLRNGQDGGVNVNIELPI